MSASQGPARILQDWGVVQAGAMKNGSQVADPKQATVDLLWP